MKHVLVTGASGFIGRHLICRLLQEGHVVRALVRNATGHRNWGRNVEVVQGDIQDARLMKNVSAGCDTVFHLAGKVHDLSAHEAVYHTVNVEGTRHLLEGAAACGVQGFVFFSSTKAMGEGTSECLDESCAQSPVTPYGRSKLLAEQIVLDYGRQAKFHAACIRPALVYGPGNKGNLDSMIRAIDRGLFPPIPDVGNRRSMVSVSDLVEAAILAATHPAANGQSYIVTDGRAYSTRVLYEMICRGLGKRIPAWHIPHRMFKTFGSIGDAIGRIRRKQFFFDSDAVEKLLGSAWYSSEKISRELGYRPAITFEEALPEIIAGYRRGRGERT